jgi:hypothetical protein
LFLLLLRSRLRSKYAVPSFQKFFAGVSRVLECEVRVGPAPTFPVPRVAFEVEVVRVDLSAEFWREAREEGEGGEVDVVVVGG